MGIAEQESASSTKVAWARFVVFWFVGNILAYFLTGFFSNFYPALYQFILLSFLFQFLFGIGAVLFLNEVGQSTQAEKYNDPFAILTLLIALALSLIAVIISWQFPGLFYRHILFMESSRLLLFVLLALISLVASTVFS